jgi:transposase
MGTKKTREYTNEFRLQAIKLASDLGSVSKAAKSLGIAQSLIYSWKSKVAKDGAEAFPGKGKLAPDEAKIKFLESEYRKLKLENEFLKKAATYFATHQK